MSFMDSCKRPKTKTVYALVDCNNFYVSCERVFNPHLTNRPVVVLSNNDGCIISRSPEAKALGIPMAAPYYKSKSLIEAHQGVALSSNYELYGDMSRRVMKTLQMFVPSVEIYSIDEAFLEISLQEDLEEFMKLIQQKVLQWTGIPISIGIGPTKTLAKLANYVAKTYSSQGIFNGCHAPVMEDIMAALPVEKVWGVSKGWREKLYHLGIHTILDFAKADVHRIRRHGNVVLQRLALEIRGIPCLSLDEVERKKSIMASRSFGHLLTDKEPILEALSHYTAKGAEKLRAQNSYTRAICVMLRTQRYKERNNYYSASSFMALPQATQDTATLIKAAREALNPLYKKGYLYQKTGVTFLDLIPADRLTQGFLFPSSPNLKHQHQSKVLDTINQRYGKHTLFYGAQGMARLWQMRCDNRSFRYTTRIQEILKVSEHSTGQAPWYLC